MFGELGVLPFDTIADAITQGTYRMAQTVAECRRRRCIEAKAPFDTIADAITQGTWGTWGTA